MDLICFLRLQAFPWHTNKDASDTAAARQGSPRELCHPLDANGRRVHRQHGSEARTDACNMGLARTRC